MKIIILAFLQTYAFATKLQNKSTDYIIKNYRFVDDFTYKQETRPISEKLFWRYPLNIKKVSFPLYLNPKNIRKEVPLTYGNGAHLAKINEGRKLFLLGKYRDAIDIWQSIRKKSGPKFEYHRRVDYFIAQAFLHRAQKRLALGKPINEKYNKIYLTEAAKYLSWSLIFKRNFHDELFDLISAKQFYNLAIIYIEQGKKERAYNALKVGQEFLRKTAQKKHRSDLYRMKAELDISEQKYREGVETLQLALKQDPSPELASAIISRAADIYFSLNNFELAEEHYAIANKVDQSRKLITPSQHILRAESLFWLNKLNQSLKHFHYALEAEGHGNTRQNLPANFAATARLRIADIMLLQSKRTKAIVEYDKTAKLFPKTISSHIAKVRLACLELPEFDGNNIGHARKLLEETRLTKIKDTSAIELAWSCEVASYSVRERTDDMVARVKSFYERFPHSRFLGQLVNPVKEVKASKLDGMFKNPHQAIGYYELHKDLLFKKITPKQKRNLFIAYVDTFQSKKAHPFWTSYMGVKRTDLSDMRKAVFLSEVSSKIKPYQKLLNAHIKKLEKKTWATKPTPQIRNYLLRINESQFAARHTKWMYNLAVIWAKTSYEETCNSLFPILARSKSLSGKIEETVSEKLPNLFYYDRNCAISFLDLELRTLKSRPGKLAALYKERDSWPLSKALITIIWEVAELNAAAGNRVNAEYFWKYILEKAPIGSPEKRFSKIRLDKSRTELEGIWE